MADPSNRLIIGLDYGTVSTAVAFQRVSQTCYGEFNIVRDWPGGVISDRVPSQISYTPVTPSQHYRQWGGYFAPGSTILRWTKLELDQQERTYELGHILDVLCDTNNLDFEYIRHASDKHDQRQPFYDPVDVIANYLARVRETLWAALLSQFGSVMLMTIPIDLVVTVPANWPELAKNRFFHAICKSGFDKAGFGESLFESHFGSQFRDIREVIIVSEEEMVAVGLLKDFYPKRREDHILPGDSIVVCHAGEVTVDLSSFQLRQFAPNFEMGQVASRKSDICGVLCVDQSFWRWLEKRLGEVNVKIIMPVPMHDRLHSPLTLSPLMVGIMRDFEIIRNRFGGIDREGDEYICLPNPLTYLTDRENGIRDGEICITEGDLEDIFQSSVTQVLELIAGQISSVELTGSKAKYVFLTGSYSDSPYLRSKIEEFLRPREISLYHPGDHRLTSALRGAMEWVTDTDSNRLVYVRKCEKHYGLSVSQPFSRSTHSEADAYHDPFDGQKKAKEQIVWLVKKGDAIFSNEPKRASTSLSRKFGRKDLRMFKTFVVISDDDEAPQRFADIPPAKRNVAAITYDFTDIPESKLTLVQEAGRGSSYLVVDFEIQLQLGANVEIWVTCNGEEKRRISVEL